MTSSSKYSAFLASLKARQECGPPIEIFLSGYTLKNKNSRDFILFDINARFKPGTMTLILGPPGCGKTSLLKSIAGVFQSRHLILSGTATYNDAKQNQMKNQLRQLVSFAGQKDLHIPTLTVKETLEFSHACRNIHRDFDTKAGTAAIIDMLGLSGCQNTLVGDDAVRGVSGGQRRRVSLGEMLTGQSPILLLDEYTTGLDTTVATEITQKLREMCITLQYTVVTALLQPPPEVFSLFDNVLILTEGHLAYFGPSMDATKYFESCGFLCPLNTDDADFLQEVTTSFGKEFKNLNNSSIPNSSIEFHQLYKESIYFNKLNLPIKNTILSNDEIIKFIPINKTPSGPSAIITSYQVIGMVYKRQFKLVSRDIKFNIIRFGQSLIMGIAIGSLYGPLGFISANVPSKVGLMFLTLLFTSVITLANIAYTIQLRDVFQKQAIFRLFPAWTYAFAESTFELLCTSLQVFLFTITTYYMCEFSNNKNGNEYGIYYTIIFLNSITITQCFKCIASFASSAVSGLIFGAAICFILIIFTGFAIPGPSIPSYFRWIFNINPGSWTFWAIMINEYQSSIDLYDFIHPKLSMRMGDYYLRLYGISIDKKYISFAFGYLLFCYFILALLTAFGYRFIRYTKRIISKKKKKIKKIPIEIIPIKNKISIEFIPVTLTFHSLHYTIQMPKQKDGAMKQIDLLSDIHGQFLPGTMTALMGTSGAGKSTLLDVLAGRKNSGKIKGIVRVNNINLNSEIQKQFGYVEQNDLHCLTATVYEALEFSAYLRLPSHVNKTDIIHSTLEILEISNDRDRRISDLSNEQSKRVTIGVELVANPSVLFLDEPTSGLDVHAAKVVLDAIHRISRSGRTVICTIHQPSFVLFEMFDSLVLLRTGGKMVYFGSLNQGKSIVDYFQSIPSIRSIHEKENPATYMLEAMASNPTIDFTTIYFNSDLCKKNDEIILSNAPLGVSDISSSNNKINELKKNSSPISTQFYFLWLRTARKYWRTREYSIGRVLIALFIAIIFGILYQNDGDTLEYSTQVQSQASLIFVGPLFMGIISIITGLPVVDAERMVFYRERASGMYDVLPYSIVFALVEIPYVLFNSFLFSIVFYYLIGLKSDFISFLWFYIFYFLYILFTTYLGQFLIVILPDLRTAVVATGGVNSIISLFAGFFIHKNNIPIGWKFMYWLSPLHYVLEGLMSTQYLNNNKTIYFGSKNSILSIENITINNFIIEMFGGGISNTNTIPNIGILFFSIIIIKIGGFFAQKYITFIKR